MSIRSSALLTVITAIAATAMPSVPLKGQQAGHEDQERAVQLMAKLQEMQEASTTVVSLLNEEYEAGNIGFPRLQEAQHDLLQIESRFANTPADRMEILSQQLELAKKAEVLIAAQYKKGSASQIDVLQTQIARMEVELAVLEETPRHPRHRPKR